ncbi:GNAT superfamily N-acetyltransferase [Pararhizobium capsulatum DSM 1112]|uniref:GNAT superfamily N-acetyltransferase n=1 Tax=Pararhizobium capsulatum DSM 1112 TaxID=1121113 RepID=A0ABU0BP54_9HYPH|nr:GNAT family N-acetyltransferase [Pararhizobium capsulatum]MDQ0318667.1 GNAT superfamily N-acetyltransferase [Pararhizobium capsulatum DSM 1112]
MNQPFRIRPAEAEDIPGIGEILVETWRHAFRGIIDGAYLDGMTEQDQAMRHARRMGAAGVSYQAAVDADGLVGFANYGPARGTVSDGIMELYALYIRPQAQGAGVGRMLIKAVARDCLSRGATGLFAWVLAENPNRGFYERLGATVTAKSMVRVGNRDYEQLAYLWSDLPQLADI